MNEGQIVFAIIIAYLMLLLGLGLFTNKLFRGTSKDYFVASHSIGPFMLLMSVFGTTMTAFALVGSSGKAFERGIGAYGLMASISGLIHAAIFFLIGIKLWAFGKKYGYVTQIQYFRARLDNNLFGYILFPILVVLVIPYLLIGVMGAGRVMQPMTSGAFPDLFPHANAALSGGLPPWLAGLIICMVVCAYVFAGGSRGAAFANTFQTIVFLVIGVTAFFLIANALGGFKAATENANPMHLVRTVDEFQFTGPGGKEMHKETGVPPWMFFTYCFVPLSVGMFPHLFQHWLTAKSAKAFRLTVIAHPLCIMLIWVPCIMIGVWATGNHPETGSPLVPPHLPSGKVIGIMVSKLIDNPFMTGVLAAGILAAIMSSLDSQFLCLGTMFTNDIVLHRSEPGTYTDKQIILMARGFIVAIVALTYLISLFNPGNIFDLAVWSFSGFGTLFPVVFAAIYWRRLTAAGAIASIVAGMVVWAFFFAMTFGYSEAKGLTFGGEMTIGPGIMPATFSFAAAAIALVVVSLNSKPPKQEVIDKFFPKAMKAIS